MKIVERNQTSMLPYRNGHFLNNITIEENKPTLDGTRTYNQLKISFTIKKDGAEDRVRDIYKYIPVTGKNDKSDSEYFNYMKYLLGAYVDDSTLESIIVNDIFGGDKTASLDNMVFTKRIVDKINSLCPNKELEVLYTPDITDWNAGEFKTWTTEAGEEKISQTICKSSYHCGYGGFVRQKAGNRKLEVSPSLLKKAEAWKPNSTTNDPTSGW